MASDDVMDVMIGSAGTAVARDADACRTHIMAGENADRAGDRWGAVAEFRKAVQFDPENPEALFRLAYGLDLTGESEEAIAIYERCVEHQPAHVNALINLAVCYEDRGSYRRAEKCLRQVLDTDPSHVRAKLYMRDVVASFDMEIDEDSERMISKHAALIDTPVTDFELSVRARNCLKKMNIRSLGDLLRITEAELLGYKNFGETSLQEIKDMLSSKGLRLGQGLDEQHDMVRQAVFDQLKGSPQEHMLAKPVADLDLSVRARKALQHLGLHTIGDLCARTEAELLGVKNFGATSLTEVVAKLDELGLGLRTIEVDGPPIPPLPPLPAEA